MTFVVPFDGSALAEAALVRAEEFATVLDESVVAVTVIPNGDEEYARERGWTTESEASSGSGFDPESVLSTIREQVEALSPTARFRYETVGKHATAGTISNRLRRTARDEGASMVFIGSENAGSMVSSLGSVGSSVAAEDAYDVVIIQNRAPSKVERVKEAAPARTAAFYERD